MHVIVNHKNNNKIMYQYAYYCYQEQGKKKIKEKRIESSTTSIQES